LNNAGQAWSLNNDINDAVELLNDEWAFFRNAKIFVTGGTGFIGKWLLNILAEANQRHCLNLSLDILSRSPDAFVKAYPRLLEKNKINLLAGNILDLKAGSKKYDIVIHAATDASADLNENNPAAMFDTVVSGTQRVLEFCRQVCEGPILFMSSGAVYGQQPWDLEMVPEAWHGGPDCLDARATYAEAKRAAEMLCAIYIKQHGLDIKIARIFALLGPYISLDIHFAAGNFIRNAMDGAPVNVNSNGLAVRSYLYASDLVVWLLKILVSGRRGVAYNVGSDIGISVRDLAKKISTLISDGKFNVLGKEDIGWNPGRYVPDVSLIKSELNVSETVSLDQSIIRTATWNGWKYDS